jgi:hypothetical protein
MGAVWFIAGFVSCLIWLYFAGQDDDSDDDPPAFA